MYHAERISSNYFFMWIAGLSSPIKFSDFRKTLKTVISRDINESIESSLPPSMKTLPSPMAHISPSLVYREQCCVALLSVGVLLVNIVDVSMRGSIAAGKGETLYTDGRTDGALNELNE